MIISTNNKITIKIGLHTHNRLLDAGKTTDYAHARSQLQLRKSLPRQSVKLSLAYLMLRLHSDSLEKRARDYS